MKIEITPSTLDDGVLFKRLLLQPEVLQYFPMFDVTEVDDSVRIWKIFAEKGASLTAKVDGTPVGIAFLNLQGYKKFEHQCLITIIVDEAYRGKGVGTELLARLFELAKDTFSMELLHLEVYDGNPAINLYKRTGFKKFGYQEKFIRNIDGSYIGKTLMQRPL